MIILPINFDYFLYALLASFLVETVRIIIGFVLAAEPSKVRALRMSKQEVESELATIKSIQVEFVRHSQLTRKVIKLDKEMEGINDGLPSKRRRVKSVLRVLRLALYVGAGIYFSAGKIVMIEPSVRNFFYE